MNRLAQEQCLSLVVIQQTKDDDVKGSCEKSFDINSELRISCSIKHGSKREISINSERLCSHTKLYDMFGEVEKLLMIFEGRFYPIETIIFYGSKQNIVCEEAAKEMQEKRLIYYLSRKNPLKIISLKDNVLLSTDLFSKWHSLINELDITHQAVLYCMAKTDFPVDVRCALIIEAYESLVELVSNDKSFFISLDPDDRNVTLKMCLDAIISSFGEGIFVTEYEKNKEKFLQILVNSRVRIMHIKKMTKGKLYFTGDECCLYMDKLFLLYRHVLLNLLGVPYEHYQENIQENVQILNEWIYEDAEGNKKVILDGLLEKLRT